jgi:hypothetical protein
MNASVNPKSIAVARALTIAAIVAWFVAAFVAGLLDRVNQPGSPPTAVLGFIAGPMLVFVAAYAASASFRAFADGLPLTLLVGSHLWRFVGVGFVIGWLYGALPEGSASAGFATSSRRSARCCLLPALRRGEHLAGGCLPGTRGGSRSRDRDRHGRAVPESTSAC